MRIYKKISHILRYFFIYSSQKGRKDFVWFKNYYNTIEITKTQPKFILKKVLMWKKIIGGIAIFAIASTAFANYDYSDMLESANDLAERKIISDKSENPSDYNLQDNVLRQEIGLVAMRLAKLDKKTSCSNMFKDLSANNPNDWACVHIETLVENNLISKNELFRPEDNITKAESLKMLIKAIGYDFEYDQNSSVSWQKQYVDFATSKGIIEEFSDYNSLASRGWVFTVAAHTIEVKTKEEKQEDDKCWEDSDSDDCDYSDEVLKSLQDFLN